MSASREELERMLAEHEEGLKVLRRMLDGATDTPAETPRFPRSRAASLRPSRNPLLAPPSEPPAEEESILASMLPPPSLPEPEPEPDQERPSAEWVAEQHPPGIEDWRELMFRPGMAQAMLYVLMPVIEQAIRAEKISDAMSAIEQMDTWFKLTLAQRVALMDLWRWVEYEVGRGEDSVVPETLRANLAAAHADYENSGVL